MKVQVSNYKNQKRPGAFTLIEMIGVLAVIAILAAVLIPKVFEAIHNSRINNSAMTCGTVKTALADHYSKFGGLNIDGSSGQAVTLATFPNDTYDQILLKEQFLDKLFSVKIGDGTNGVANTHVQLTTNAPFGGAVLGDATSGYFLSGTGVTATNECNGSHIVQAIITGVTGADAQALSQRIDGNSMSAADAATADLAGRVKYATPVAGVTTVYVYITHR